MSTNGALHTSRVKKINHIHVHEAKMAWGFSCGIVNDVGKRTLSSATPTLTYRWSNINEDTLEALRVVFGLGSGQKSKLGIIERLKSVSVGELTTLGKRILGASSRS